MNCLIIDFKELLPTSSRNKYLFTVIDEYSRYPFAVSISDISSTTVVKCLDQIFSFCGFPTYIHSDRDSSFISNELKSYLIQKGIVTSNSTPYYPISNREEYSAPNEKFYQQE